MQPCYGNAVEERLEASPVGIAPPMYTPEEISLLHEAEAVVARAWEAGHFSDLMNSTSRGTFAHSLASMHRAAERAQLLVPEGVRVVARSTTIGDKLFVGIPGRL